MGLTLPGLTRILPWLVVWAAGGVMIATGAATVFHVARGEMRSAVITFVLFGMAGPVSFAIYRRGMRHALTTSGDRD